MVSWRDGVNIVVWSTVQTRRKIADIHSCRLLAWDVMDGCCKDLFGVRFVEILIGVPIALALGGGGSASDNNKLSADYCHVE